MQPELCPAPSGVSIFDGGRNRTGVRSHSLLSEKRSPKVDETSIRKPPQFLSGSGVHYIHETRILSVSGCCANTFQYYNLAEVRSSGEPGRATRDLGVES